MSKPILILRSPLSRRYYATKAYKWEDKEKGILTVTGKQEDVTDQIEKYIEDAIKERGLTQ